MSDEDFSEERANLRQRIGELERKVENMTLLRTEEGMSSASARLAHVLEDMWAQAHGSRAARFAQMQIAIHRAFQLMLRGEVEWNPGSRYQGFLKDAQGEHR